MMTRPQRLFSLLLAILCLIAFTLPSIAQEATPDPQPTAAPRPRPFPETVLTEDGFTVEIYFDNITQGQVGMVHVVGADITEVRMRAFNRLIEFFPMPDDGYYGLLAVGMEQNPRVYDLSIFVFLADGTRTAVTAQFEVTMGAFIRQDFAISEDRAHLASVEVERSEFARLESIFSTVTTERFWSGAFQFPITSELTSPFGAFRIINETVPTRHTGWDLRAPVGTPVMAMAAGRVAFAGVMDIRGNYILIDHGYGIYTGYAHNSQIHVTRGQSVAQGQIIGVSGNTGRSSGPHVHFEIAVNGEWIDGVEFLRMWLPG